MLCLALSYARASPTASTDVRVEMAEHSPDDTRRGQGRDRRLVPPEPKDQQIRMIRHKRTQTDANGSAFLASSVRVRLCYLTQFVAARPRSERDLGARAPLEAR
jgi:hypothetical protein